MARCSTGAHAPISTRTLASADDWGPVTRPASSRLIDGQEQRDVRAELDGERAAIASPSSDEADQGAQRCMKFAMRSSCGEAEQLANRFEFGAQRVKLSQSGSRSLPPQASFEHQASATPVDASSAGRRLRREPVVEPYSGHLPSATPAVVRPAAPQLWRGPECHSCWPLTGHPSALARAACRALFSASSECHSRWRSTSCSSALSSAPCSTYD